MPGSGTTRLYRPDPTSAEESRKSGTATFAVHRRNALRTEIAITGEIDAANGRALGQYVERHTGTSTQLLLDLRSVDFFGSQGFTALFYISVHCSRGDVDWMLLGGPPVRRLLTICDPHGELPLAADYEAAIARLNQQARRRMRAATAG
ncbi:anti-anti-sigma factor [Mycobacterium sp. MS1601]|uniref:STAS domain-containing protein n=1 Tax=Mycobacterium sp. MS1601 TaxID=1936029 RepID=UPI00097954B3|nr:STAS domain-containing protein [Mycobacterium sp. MS1601]AQA06581.1 anti-anti-sigma factor [Mycobacterium sp. MS1601]